MVGPQNKIFGPDLLNLDSEEASAGEAQTLCHFILTGLSNCACLITSAAEGLVSVRHKILSSGDWRCLLTIARYNKTDAVLK